MLVRPMPLRRGAPRSLSLQQGSALLLVLGVLVLILGITLAFFSRAALQRQISASSASNAQAGFLADLAQKVVLQDIAHEIEAGSQADPLNGAKVKVKAPRLFTSSSLNAPAAPSLRLQLVGNEGTDTEPPIPSVLKVSRDGEPFFAMGDGYAAAPGFSGTAHARASAVSTETASANRREITKSRWNFPALMTAEELPRFQSPDWIYVDREGKNPTSFTTSALATLSDAKLGNDSHVIGRFAYVIYDVGGLLDANMVGNALTAADNARRGRLHQVSLAPAADKADGDIAFENFSDFVDWRWPVSQSNGTEAENGLFDPSRDFRKVAAGEQAFINRQDLIRYAQDTGNIPVDGLPYLTTSSQDINGPAFGSKDSLALANPPPDTEMNPTLLHVRFPEDVTLDRPPLNSAGGDVSVEAGTPVMFRRFPLSKIDLFSAETLDADAIAYYFGLRRNSDGNWEYIADKGGRIAKLWEVAEDGREPNFFEVLQAVIDNGSLGRNAGDSVTFDDERDSLQNLQIMQIGANIIDQWDADDTPTTVRYPGGSAGEWEDRYGIENLPYLNNMMFVPHWTEYNRDRFQVWAVFDIWNPHQNAATAPQDITRLRIKATKGKPYVFLQFTSDNFSGSPPGNALPSVSIKQDIISLNGGKEFEFDAFKTGGYVEPTVVGGSKPVSAISVPGILFADMNVGPAIDPDDPVTGPYWTSFGFGKKAYNLIRMRPPAEDPLAVDPDELVTLELQALVDGEWRTYQVLDEFMSPNRVAKGTDTLSQINISVGGTTYTKENTATWPINTHYTKAPDASNPTLLDNSFYGWRLPSTSIIRRGVSFVKFDPRTIRFGHSGNQYDPLGTTIRQSAAAYNGTTTDSANFRIVSGNFVAGTTTTSYTPPYLFEKAIPNGSSARLPAFGFVYNSPDGVVDNGQPARYEDRDGVVRPADGYLGALPTVPSRFADRPVLLNRPFRSVGEMSYAFRDLPWKTIDFFSKQSGDLGLLDAFSIDEAAEVTPVVSGKVNLNTRRPEVLAALLRQSANGVSGAHSAVTPGTISSADANAIAEAIVDESERAPFLFVGDVVSRVLAPVSDSDATPVGGGTWKPIIKTVRESAIRTLSGLTTTRTWNLMIDLVVQPGRFSANSKSGADFFVKAERRYWIHLTIDRMTGQVVDRKLEIVNE